MGFLNNIRQGIGNVVDKVGTRFGLPEKGWSETIASGRTVNTAPGISYGGAQVAPPRMAQPPRISNAPVIQNTPGPAPRIAGTPPPPPGPSLEELQRQGLEQEAALIRQQYDQGAAYLDNLKQSYQSAFPGIQQSIQGRFDPMRQTLDTSREQAMVILGNQREDSQMQQQNALAEARALHSELLRGQQQRFGGSPGTGQFASELQGREFARQAGDINQTGMRNERDLGVQEQQIQQNYQNAKLQIDGQAQEALADAQRQLEDQLRQIEASRFELGQNKTNMRIDALREFNANRQNIEAQKRQFEQQLSASAIQAQQNIYGSVQSARAEMGAPVDLAGMPGAQFSTFSGPQATAAQQAFNPMAILRDDEEQQFA